MAWEDLDVELTELFDQRSGERTEQVLAERHRHLKGTYDRQRKLDGTMLARQAAWRREKRKDPVWSAREKERRRQVHLARKAAVQRFVVELPRETHAALKALAARRHTSVRALVLKGIAVVLVDSSRRWPPGPLARMKCERCGQDLPVAAFSHAAEGKDDREGWCNECSADRRKRAGAGDTASGGTGSGEP